MNTREIVSLQFGHYSNFIGTHWWNIQETGFDYAGDSPSEINHDVLFREGLTNKGEVTYTPRLLLVDLKGSLKTLPERGDLYETVSEPAISSVPWLENAVEIITEEKPAKNEFQQALATPETSNLNHLDSECLDGKVNVWSDFLYSRFHPRTVNIIRGYQHESASVPFDVYPLGTNLWKEPEFSEDFCDKIRSYIEECDSPQGFQVTVDAVNAFGGLATSCLEYIKDEYDRKSVLTFAAVPSYYSDYNYSNADEREESTKKDSLRLLNLALTLEALSEHSSLTIPVSTGSKGWRQPGPKREFHHIVYNSDLPYHSSAILASALDTVTMPYRLKSSGFTVGDFCRDLSGYGRKISAASLCLPFGMRSGVDLIDCLDNWDGPLWQSITPNCTMGSEKLMQIVTARGIPETRLKRPPQVARKQREMAAYRCESVKEMLSFYLSCSCYASASHVTTLSKPLPIKTPYPKIFDEYVGVNGDILDVPRKNTEDVKNIPVIAACHAGSGVGNMLETLHREAGRIKLARFHQFKTTGLELDDYNESLGRLLDLRECYEESFE